MVDAVKQLSIVWLRHLLLCHRFFELCARYLTGRGCCYSVNSLNVFIATYDWLRRDYAALILLRLALSLISRATLASPAITLL